MPGNRKDLGQSALVSPGWTGAGSLLQGSTCSQNPTHCLYQMPALSRPPRNRALIPTHNAGSVEIIVSASQSRDGTLREVRELSGVTQSGPAQGCLISLGLCWQQEKVRGHLPGPVSSLPDRDLLLRQNKSLEGL